MTFAIVLELCKKVAQTKTPEDWKAYSDAFDELTPEELEKVSAGHSNGGYDPTSI
jgi:hypothetical protein